MAWIRIVQPKEAHGGLQQAYEDIATARGKIARVVAVHGLNPQAMRAMMDLYLAVMFGASPLSRGQREMIATAVSAINGCDYCVAHHAEALRVHVRNEDIVAAVSTDYRRFPLDPKDRTLLDYASKLTLHPSKITEADIARLREAGFEDRAILDANLVVSLFAYFNRVVSGLGVRLEDDRGRGYRY